MPRNQTIPNGSARSPLVPPEQPHDVELDFDEKLVRDTFAPPAPVAPPTELRTLVAQTLAVALMSQPLDADDATSIMIELGLAPTTAAQNVLACAPCDVSESMPTETFARCCRWLARYGATGAWTALAKGVQGR